MNGGGKLSSHQFYFTILLHSFCARVQLMNESIILLFKKFSIRLYHHIGTDIKWIRRPNVKIRTVYDACYLEAGFVFFIRGIVQGSAIPHIHCNRFGNAMHGQIA